MYQTTSKLNGYSTSVKVFDSVSEITETVRGSANARSVLNVFACENKAGFLGRKIDSPNHLLSEVDGTWDHGLEVIENMLERLADVQLPAPISRVRRTRYNADNGDEVCRDRLMSGQDFWRESFRQPVYGNPVITINAAVGCLMSVKADNVLWRGAAAIAMTKILESAGYSVELWATSHSDCTTGFADDSACFTAIKLKSAGDTLNESSLVNAVSAWFFRTVIFASRYLTLRYDGGSVGRTISQSESESFATHISDDPNVLTIEDCFTFNEAAQVARELIQQVCDRAEGMVA